MGVSAIFPKTAFTIAGISITNTVVHTWIVMAILIGSVFWFRSRIRTWNPPKWQVAIEWVLEYVRNLIADSVGVSLPDAEGYLTTMISFIAISNLLGLLPLLQAPTRDLNTTLALAIVSLISCHYFGASRKGILNQIKSFGQPNPIMLPINILGQFSRTLSMALRLFGNVVAGEVIAQVMFILLPVLGPVPLSFLSMVTGVLQALVFTVLTIVFIVDAIGNQQLEPANA